MKAGPSIPDYRLLGQASRGLIRIVWDIESQHGTEVDHHPDGEGRQTPPGALKERANTAYL
jgi:hypothetical protein